MIGIFVPSSNSIRSMRRAHLHSEKTSQFPSVSAPLDGISQEKAIKEAQNDSNSFTEHALESSLASLSVIETLKPIPHFKKILYAPHKTSLASLTGHRFLHHSKKLVV